MSICGRLLGVIRNAGMGRGIVWKGKQFFKRDMQLSIDYTRASMNCCEFLSSNTPSFYKALSPCFQLGITQLNDIKRSLGVSPNQEPLLDICKDTYLII